jgi:predicted O-linked N-acetylglucosamine transferase (SPINDLY family)
LNARVIDLWCDVLRALPDARLILFRHTLVGSVRDYFYRQFTERGIARDRLDLRQGSVAPGYLGVYDDIDISFDTFPFSAGTTTAEALWMGVPMLSLAGPRPASRGSAMLLARVELSDWAVETPQQYGSLAVRWANDLDQLAQLRSELRQRMAATLCDGHGFTRVLEATYRGLWRRWCARR